VANRGTDRASVVRRTARPPRLGCSRGRGGWEIAIEAETHVRDLQALERRLALKQRDGDMSVLILVLGDTRHHRELVSGAGIALRSAFPTTARSALRSLGRAERPGSNALVLV
jgi:hypothetical protein